jgi:hypothetical protein
MKLLLVFLIVTIGYTGHASALTCADYGAVERSAREGIQKLEARRKTIGNTPAEQCNFFTRDYLLWQQIYTWDVQHYKVFCDEPIRSTATAYYEELQKTLTSIEDYNKANCPK